MAEFRDNWLEQNPAFQAWASTVDLVENPVLPNDPPGSRPSRGWYERADDGSTQAAVYTWEFDDHVTVVFSVRDDSGQDPWDLANTTLGHPTRPNEPTGLDGLEQSMHPGGGSQWRGA
jgi:hypothetical protein